MNITNGMMKKMTKLALLLMIGISMSACAGLFGFGSTSWKEEALLHDGSKIIVDRSVSRGGRHEIGQQPPYKEQSLSFTMPGTNQNITWEDHYIEDIGSASFLPMAVDIHQGTAYLVANTMGCLSYNKWGRPNPPYVIFKYVGKAWQRITLIELPAEIKRPNLIYSMPDTQVEKMGKRFVSVEIIQKIIGGYPQPEYRTILRDALKNGSGATGCEELVHYKCGWGAPGKFNKEYFERTCK